jgi:hypothetical protein
MTVGNIRIFLRRSEITVTHKLCRNIQQHRITVSRKAMNFADYGNTKFYFVPKILSTARAKIFCPFIKTCFHIVLPVKMKLPFP